MRIYSSNEIEGSKSDNSSEEDEEEGGEGSGPLAGMLCRKYLILEKMSQDLVQGSVDN